MKNIYRERENGKERRSGEIFNTVQGDRIFNKSFISSFFQMGKEERVEVIMAFIILFITI